MQNFSGKLQITFETKWTGAIWNATLIWTRVPKLVIGARRTESLIGNGMPGGKLDKKWQTNFSPAYFFKLESPKIKDSTVFPLLSLHHSFQSIFDSLDCGSPSGSFVPTIWHQANHCRIYVSEFPGVSLRVEVPNWTHGVHLIARVAQWAFALPYQIDNFWKEWFRQHTTFVIRSILTVKSRK